MFPVRAASIAILLGASLASPQTPSRAFRFTAGQLDLVGRQLAERGQPKDAARILAFNAERYADTPGVLESLGEVRAMANDTTGAIDAYRRALAKFPGSASAREMIRHLERP